MDKTFTVVYDGEVLRPEAPLDLRPNLRYTVTVRVDDIAGEDENFWTMLDSIAGTVEAPPDWSSETDHYLYGTPKQNQDATP